MCLSCYAYVTKLENRNAEKYKSAMSNFCASEIHEDLYLFSPSKLNTYTNPHTKPHTIGTLSQETVSMYFLIYLLLYS